MIGTIPSGDSKVFKCQGHVHGTGVMIKNFKDILRPLKLCGVKVFGGFGNTSLHGNVSRPKL